MSERQHATECPPDCGCGFCLHDRGLLTQDGEAWADETDPSIDQGRAPEDPVHRYKLESSGLALTVERIGADWRLELEGVAGKSEMLHAASLLVRAVAEAHEPGEITDALYKQAIVLRCTGDHLGGE